ncbi:MAG: choice-of-anchor D domain-containing protein [Actinobacteria bacterium]|nr:choice-of-anchor D domain-containing protein [Actinomycetota bacterium]
MENDLVPFRRLLLGAVSLLLVACLIPAMASAAPVESSPTSLDFGQETVGKVSTAKTVEIIDPGPGAVQVVGATVAGLDAGDFAVAGEGCGGRSLQPSEGCQVEVVFEPQAGGARSATLEVAIEGQAAIEVPLSGTGQTMRLTVPASTTFPTTTVGSASTEKVALKNSSEAGVDVTEVKIEGADPGDFGIEGNNCVGFIGPGMSCELNVRFSPGASGVREALLRVVTDGTPAELTTELSGEGSAPELTFEPGGHDFGLSEVHSGGSRANFTLRNTGAASVPLSNLEITGPDAGEFWIPNSNCWGSTLSPGSTCAVEVQFNANNEGSYSAAISIQAGGVGFVAPLTARAERPKVTASPAPLVFGPTPVGSRQVKEVTLTNTGHLPVAFFISLVSGGDIGSFHLLEENCTSNVFAGQPRIFEPGESCAAKVAFEPTVDGAKAATLSVFGGGEGALQVPVQGEAVAAQLQVSPTSRDFGSVAIGTAGPVQTFQLRNESDEAQTVGSAVLTGPDLGEFQIRSDECSEAVLEPGGSCAVAVRFAPEAAGPKTATLRLRSPAGTSVARLGGEGAAPAVSTTSASGDAHHGRVTLSLRTRPGPAAGKVTLGRARCESSEVCTIRVRALAIAHLTTLTGSRPVVRRVPVATLSLTPGGSAPIVVAVPPELRKAAADPDVRVSLRWRTGPERGGTFRAYRLS